MGGKWNQYPVYFQISGVSTSYISEIKSGAYEWNGNADIALRYEPDWDHIYSNIVNDITVSYMSNDAYWTNQGAYGFGIPSPVDGPTYYSGSLYVVKGNFSPLSSHDQEMVVAHEFGHLLGLAHTSDTWNPVNSIMDEGDVFDGDMYGPTSYDIEELRDLYPY